MPCSGRCNERQCPEFCLGLEARPLSRWPCRTLRLSEESLRRAAPKEGSSALLTPSTAAPQVCCCFANSVVTTRWMLQDEMIIANTECDNCLMAWLM